MDNTKQDLSNQIPDPSINSTPESTSSSAINPISGSSPSSYIDQNPPASSKMRLIIIMVVIVVIVMAAAGYYYLTMMQKSAITPTPPAQPSAPTTQTKLTPTPTDKMPLVLDSPTDSSLVKSAKVKVKGKTAPNATVVIYTEIRDTSVESDASGNFEAEVTLSAGINTLTVVAFSDAGDEKTATLTVTYDNQS